MVRADLIKSFLIFSSFLVLDTFFQYFFKYHYLVLDYNFFPNGIFVRDFLIYICRLDSKLGTNKMRSNIDLYVTKIVIQN